MIDVMIEEVQDLECRLNGIELTVDELKKKYECEITTSSLTQLRNYLVILHQEMMYGKLGMFNANDL